MRFKKQKDRARVVGVYLSARPEASEEETDYFVTQEVPELTFTVEGVVWDRHFGHTRKSGTRQKSLYTPGTEIRNNRQWSAIATQELAVTRDNLGLEGKVTPELIGANLFLEGFPNLSDLPGGTYLVCTPHEGDFVPGRPEDVVLVNYAQNNPCAIAGKAVGEPHSRPDIESKFSKAAMGTRGIVGTVEQGGIVRPDYKVWIMHPIGID